MYANVGEVRPNVAPLKPQRTGSVRDVTVDGPRRTPLAAALEIVVPTLAKDSTEEPPKMTTRTCSLPAATQPEDSGYESVELSDSAQPQSMTDSDNVYECVNGTGERSSSPECDSKRTGSVGGAAGGGTRGGSGECHHSAPPPGVGVNGDGSGDYQRLNTFGRPASVHYCGSETESDIYSPYSFYGSEEGDDGEADSSWKWRSRTRKGRSVVHKSMEDNYGAVVGANHEALAQLLEQIRTGPAVPAALRPLKALGGSTLTWSHFTMDVDQDGIRDAVVAGRWVFLPALWGCQPVTLGVAPLASNETAAMPAPGSSLGRGPFSLLPIVEFTDRVPSSCLPGDKRQSGSHVQALVAVLARARVDTMSTYAAWLGHREDSRGQDQDGSKSSSDEFNETEAAWREAALALLQLMNALRALQAHGKCAEEMDTHTIVFLRDPASLEQTPQLALLGLPSGVLVAKGASSKARPEARMRSVRQCALEGVRALLPSAPPANLLTSLLRDQGRSEAEALCRAKAVLEYWLWGPPLGPTGLREEGLQGGQDRESGLQRWLDLERATVLHRLVCARAAAGPSHRLAIPQQSHLLFLVHTSAKTMSGASQLLEAEAITPLETSL